MKVKKIIKPNFSTLFTQPQSHTEKSSLVSPRQGSEILGKNAGPGALGVPMTTHETSGEFFTSSESLLARLKMGIPTEQGR